ncbi:MAG: hypothetical protein IJE19_03070 [Clostridia bacterium]|nr:hypothetical protein [Clostridia bacterium]
MKKLFVAIKKWIASYIQHRMLEKKKSLEDPKYRKFEFSKKIAVFCCIMMSFSYLLSVILSIFDKDPITDITVAVFTVCGGGILGYIVKSAFEKNSRNKYGLDEFGNPLGIDNFETDEIEETEEEIYG